MVFHHSVPILYSSDVKKSIDYYIEILGFDSRWTWDDPPTFGGVNKDRVELFFCKQGQGNRGTWISVMVDDVDELYERIQAKGAKIVSPPKNMEWNLREMLVEDPDQHVIRFGQSISLHKKKSNEFPGSIRLIERIPTTEEYNTLIKAVNWKTNDELVVAVLKAPLYAVVAEDIETNKVIGCVLLLGDHASFYYVKDMMVHPEYQAKRIGSALMKKLNEWLEKNASDDALVGLYTGPNLAHFYSQFGFKDSFGMTKRIRNKDKQAGKYSS
jgi:GNAT superfamily N-acetyltransferase/predicted enzyme related to lactoylglutathione lyase